MIDVDESGDLEKEEIVIAVKSNQKVIKFLVNCGEPNLQNLLVPSRLEATLHQPREAAAIWAVVQAQDGCDCSGAWAAGGPGPGVCRAASRQRGEEPPRERKLLKQCAEPLMI